MKEVLSSLTTYHTRTKISCWNKEIRGQTGNFGDAPRILELQNSGCVPEITVWPRISLHVCSNFQKRFLPFLQTASPADGIVQEPPKRQHRLEGFKNQFIKTCSGRGAVRKV